MKIQPRQITLGANERAILRDAIELRLKDLNQKARNAKTTARYNRLSDDRARLSDLLVELEG